MRVCNATQRSGSKERGGAAAAARSGMPKVAQSQLEVFKVGIGLTGMIVANAVVG